MHLPNDFLPHITRIQSYLLRIDFFGTRVARVEYEYDEKFEYELSNRELLE